MLIFLSGDVPLEIRILLAMYQEVVEMKHRFVGKYGSLQAPTEFDLGEAFGWGHARDFW